MNSQSAADRYAQYRELATERQLEYIEAYLAEGSIDGAAVRAGVHRRTLQRSLKALEARATKVGTGGHFMGPPVPAGLSVYRTTTLHHAEKGQLMQYVMARSEGPTPEEILEAFEAIEPRSSIDPVPSVNIDNNDLLAVYIMPEPHIGMLAWAEECGEDYDMKIARRTIAAGIDHLSNMVGTVPHCLLLDGGDYFHYSGRTPQTEKSKNQLSADGRWQKAMTTGLEIYTDAIDTLAANSQQLDVVRVPGNHDPDWSLWLDSALHLGYRLSPHINVSIQPHKAKAYQWGDTMLIVDHGEKKIRDMCEFAAAEWHEMWGTTRYRYVWNGHIHHKVVEEYKGVTAESINSIAARDDYHTNEKYKSHRSMLAVIYHKKYGEVCRHIFRPEMMAGA